MVHGQLILQYNISQRQEGNVDFLSVKYILEYIRKYRETSG